MTEKTFILNADDFQVKMSLLPLLAKRIEVDAIQLKKLEIWKEIENENSGKLFRISILIIFILFIYLSVSLALVFSFGVLIFMKPLMTR